MNEAIKRYYRLYGKSKWHSVREAYGRPSLKKIRIENEIKKRISDPDSYRVLTAGQSVFACGYIEGEWFVFETKANIAKAKIDELKREMD